jgi:wyosine [tRNA(Phe)-imidazoG37] synthetase (radical SAM superfamily)
LDIPQSANTRFPDTIKAGFITSNGVRSTLKPCHRTTASKDLIMMGIETLVHRLFLAYSDPGPDIPRVAPRRASCRLIRSAFFGASVEIDAAENRTCPFNCIYCSHAKTVLPTIDRFDDTIAKSALRQEVSGLLQKETVPKFIVLGGIGDPALNRDLKTLTGIVRDITAVPIALHTSGGALWRHDVQHDLQYTNVVLASFDAANKSVFQAVNRPSALVPFERLFDGIAEFSRLFKGEFWVRITLTTGLNTDERHVSQLSEALRRIRADKIFVQEGPIYRSAENSALSTADIVRLLASNFGDKVILTQRVQPQGSVFPESRSNATMPAPQHGTQKIVAAKASPAESGRARAVASKVFN